MIIDLECGVRLWSAVARHRFGFGRRRPKDPRTIPPIIQSGVAPPHSKANIQSGVAHRTPKQTSKAVSRHRTPKQTSKAVSRTALQNQLLTRKQTAAIVPATMHSKLRL